MEKLKLIITGDPIAKMRPRFRIAGKAPRQFISSYSVQGELEEMYKFLIKQQLPRGFFVIKNPVFLHLWFGLCRPRNHFGTGRNSGKLKPSAPKFPQVMPDIDNYEKFILDCMNKIVFKDDRLVISIRSDKRYTENPRTEIMVQELDQGKN
jgi:Holliday junction resolvase RusA-like endonuclease